MKRIVLLFAALFSVSMLFSQEVFRLGTVKGEYVTYKVREQKDVPTRWIVRNVHNPDTAIKIVPNPGVIFSQEKDIEMQIAKILHEHLSAEELLEMKTREKEGGVCWFEVILRVDRNKYKLLQVTCFRFCNKYMAGMRRPPEKRQDYPASHNDFWLNIDPDRLHAIEKDIVKRVLLPEKMPEILLTDDFNILIMPRDLGDIKKIKEERKKAIERWKKEDVKPRAGWPPMIL